MQLVAYGAQDIYLTGNPQITFFKVVYRRHTNFSMESIEQTPNGAGGFGGRSSYTISRNGDLVHQMYFEINPAAIILGGAPVACVGNTLLREVSLEIGGQLIDKHHREWLTAWADLTEQNELGATGTLVNGEATAGGGSYGRNPIVINASGTTDGDMTTVMPATRWQRMSYNIRGVDANELDLTTAVVLPAAIHRAFVPLRFWFNRNPGLALPLIALQYHEVKVIAEFATQAEISTGMTTGVLNNTNCRLFADYIYLDTDERRRFAQVSHEYLIEQVQREVHSASASYNLNFNHPVKELVWGGTPAAGGSAVTSAGCLAPVARVAEADEITIKLNGHERFSRRHPTYFTQQQVNQFHSGYGAVMCAETQLLESANTLHVYSFALKPEEHQPSGTCNFSRIDSAQLVYDQATTNGITIFAVNYNVLRIMSGMGGLAYSN